MEQYEIAELSGKCICGCNLEIRIADYREDKNKIATRLGFIIYGLCNRCKKMYVLYLHREKIEPTEGIDYVINLNKVVEQTKFNQEEWLKK